MRSGLTANTAGLHGVGAIGPGTRVDEVIDLTSSGPRGLSVDSGPKVGTEPTWTISNLSAEDVTELYAAIVGHIRQVTSSGVSDVASMDRHVRRLSRLAAVMQALADSLAESDDLSAPAVQAFEASGLGFPASPSTTSRAVNSVA